MSLGMTQDELREQLQLKNRQSVSAWEKGRSMPTLDAWFQLGRMGMSLDYVVLNIRTVPVSQYAAASNLIRLPVIGARDPVHRRAPADLT